jgi:hypothetical protein
MLIHPSFFFFCNLASLLHLNNYRLGFIYNSLIHSYINVFIMEHFSRSSKHFTINYVSVKGEIPVFLKADIGFSGVADFMYAAQASWHTSSFMITVDDKNYHTFFVRVYKYQLSLVAESGKCVLIVHEL